MCTTCSTIARRLDQTRAPDVGEWFIEHAIGRGGIPVAYTVGLTGLDLPELIIRDVPFGMAHGFLHGLVEPALGGSTRLAAGTTTVSAGHELLLRRYVHSAELTEAIRRYDGIIGVLQVILATDPAGTVVLPRSSRVTRDAATVATVVPFNPWATPPGRHPRRQDGPGPDAPGLTLGTGA